MADFKTICILGRQPALGLAELERLYGAERIRPIDGAALLDIDAGEINFKQLGGTIKVAKILSELPTTKWSDLTDYLKKAIPQHLANAPSGKFTLGLSVYGLSVRPDQINKDLLSLKKVVKATRSIRIVPNKTLALNSAQVLHNKLTSRGAWELLVVKNGTNTILAQTMFVQDIEAYAARDHARPKRDARVGMLPPKLAQIMVNLAVGNVAAKLTDEDNKELALTRVRLLDPFCGTGVILQEAMLMGYSVLGTDIEPRMVEYTKTNLAWLVGKNPQLQGHVDIELGDATNTEWPGFSGVASEAYLGRPLTALPAIDKLTTIINDVDTITKKFLLNLGAQIKPERTVCLAVPAWRKPNGQIIRLPLLDKLTDMGYNRLDLKYVRNDDLIYYRENQVVARQLLILRKTSNE